MLNKTIVQGRLCADPELRRTNNGTAVCSFRLAWSETVKERETKLFLPCVAWQSTAERVSKFFLKGKEVIVEGKLSTREYEDRDGNRRSVTELTVDRVHFCGPKNSESDSGGYKPAGKPVSVDAEDFAEIEDDGDLPF